MAISIKQASSVSLLLPHPSDILVGIEAQERRKQKLTTGSTADRD
jgi:hypothetical protein